MLQINRRFLKFSQKKSDLLELDHDYNMDQEIMIEVTGQIGDVKYSTNNDGTVDAIYYTKPLLSDDIKVK